ncbi:hypothetical protein DPMN_124383 [Dreissena polymorpha]|uniref:Uncharacterized protein n=1 Tax=Dreissena polymorpha TaxID=45954 RepID=A0A9D4GWA5_DREPO|nr:hypothetical protein DPMN_124383 [Dreissena polymorpha]
MIYVPSFPKFPTLKTEQKLNWNHLALQEIACLCPDLEPEVLKNPTKMLHVVQEVCNFYYLPGVLDQLVP